MRTATLGLILIAAASAAASAQRSGTDSSRAAARTEQLTTELRDALFRGIPLSASGDSSALAIIRDAVVERSRLDPTAPSFRQQAIRFVQHRDSLLRQLLTRDDERRRFATNASSHLFVLDGDVMMNPPLRD